MRGITVVGASHLAATLGELLHAEVQAELPCCHPQHDDSSLVVWVRDGRDWSRDLAMQRLLRQQPQPWLPVWRAEDELWVGPWQQGQQRGCIACLRHRLRAASHSRVDFDAFDRHTVPPLDVPLLPPSLATIGTLIHDEWQRHQAGLTLRTAQAVLCHSLRSFTWAHHPVVPDPACAQCATADPAATQLPSHLGLPKPPDLQGEFTRPLRKERASTYRLRAEPPNLGRLRRRFVSCRTGLIQNELRHPDQGWLPISEAKLILAEHDGHEPGMGRDFNYAATDRVALLEALERHAGLWAGENQAVVVGSYADLHAQAIDPSRLILHHPGVYQGPNPFLTPYTPNLSMRWVWAYSCTQGRPVLVPAQAVYYSGAEEQRSARFLVETSNGCALGSTLAEAAFHALLELIERDAFMLTWYARLPVPRLRLDTVTDPRLLDLIDRVVTRGMVVDAFNITTDIRVPAVAVVIWNPSGQAPFASVAAGAHPEPGQALKAGLLEAAAFLPNMPELLTRAGARAPDPAAIRTMEDHRTLYLFPQSRKSLDFLLQPGRHQEFTGAFADLSPPPYPDVQQDLGWLVSCVQAVGLDVLIVDQTPPELRAEGLHAARVLVPGSLPLTFGHHLRRADGAERIFTAPLRMGYAAPAAINPDPHPFC